MKTTIQLYEHNSQRIALKIPSYHTLVSCEICIQMEIRFAQADFILDQRASSPTQGFYAGVCCHLPEGHPLVFAKDNFRTWKLSTPDASTKSTVTPKTYIGGSVARGRTQILFINELDALRGRRSTRRNMMEFKVCRVEESGDLRLVYSWHQALKALPESDVCNKAYAFSSPPSIGLRYTRLT